MTKRGRHSLRFFARVHNFLSSFFSESESPFSSPSQAQVVSFPTNKHGEECPAARAEVPKTTLVEGSFFSFLADMADRA